MFTSGEVNAKYRYGSYASGTDKGVYLFGELLWANPRNVDAVVATQETVQNFGGGTNTLTTIVPTWDDQISGRLLKEFKRNWIYRKRAARGKTSHITRDRSRFFTPFHKLADVSRSTTP